MREAWNVLVFQYMDDLVFLHSSSEQLAIIMERAVRFLRWLGWTVNMEKSKMVPSQTFTYLGMEWDTREMTVRLTSEKNKQLKKTNKTWIRRARNGETVRVREFAGMIGALSATRVQHKQASLCLTTMYRILSVTIRHVGWEGNVTLSRQLLPQLHWWRRQLKANAPRPFQPHNPTVTIETDASDTGWGGTLQRKTAQIRLAFGWWKGTMLIRKDGKIMTSNKHKLRAVERTLRLGLATHEILPSDDVLLRSDSTTVVFNVNRQAAGLNLRPALRSLLRLAEEMGIRIHAEYVPGVENTVPDALSRLSRSGDYSLRPGVLRNALRALGVEIQIDWFANKRNKQHDQYCTLVSDRNAGGHDGMQQDWSRKLGLLHPPIPMLVRCLRKVQDEHAVAVLIAPGWQGMLWTPLLEEMVVKRETLGLATQTLQMGPAMRRRGGQLPPGLMMAYLIRG
jgi:hypothetical protein